MYSNLTKKLNALLDLVKTVNRVTRAKALINRENDPQLKALRAAFAHAHGLGDEELKQETQKHIDRRIGELQSQEETLRAKVGNLGLERAKPKEPKKKPASPFEMKDAEEVLKMPHDQGKELAWNKVHGSTLNQDHKGELKYRIHKTKDPVELSKLISDHVLSPYQKFIRR